MLNVPEGKTRVLFRLNEHSSAKHRGYILEFNGHHALIVGIHDSIIYELHIDLLEVVDQFEVEPPFPRVPPINLSKNGADRVMEGIENPPELNDRLKKGANSILSGNLDKMHFGGTLRAIDEHPAFSNLSDAKKNEEFVKFMEEKGW